MKTDQILTNQILGVKLKTCARNTSKSVKNRNNHQNHPFSLAIRLGAITIGLDAIASRLEAIY